MNFLYLFTAALATYRLALMISSEEGPFRIFRWLRRQPPPRSNLREGLSCKWCTSVWVSAAVTTFLWSRGLFLGPEWPLWWLAISGLAIGFNQLWTKGAG